MSEHAARPIEGAVFVNSRVVSPSGTLEVESVAAFIQPVYRSVVMAYLQVRMTEALKRGESDHWARNVFLPRVVGVHTRSFGGHDYLFDQGNLAQLANILQVGFDNGDEVCLISELLGREFWAESASGLGFRLSFRENNSPSVDETLQRILEKVVEEKISKVT